jgi:hypothetical protein
MCHIIVHHLGNADHGQFVPVSLGDWKQIVASTLCATSADCLDIESVCH